MSVKTVVTCDRCSLQWEAEGGIGSHCLDPSLRVHINLCVKCEEEFLVFLDNREVVYLLMVWRFLVRL